MANRVLASIDGIFGEPGNAACNGHVLPEGGGNPVIFEARWPYGATNGAVQNAIDLAIRDAMTAANLPMAPSDKVTLFGAMITF